MTVVSAAGDHSNWDHYSNEEHHAAHNNSDVEANTDASVSLLRVFSGAQGHDGQDEGRDGERETDD